MRSSFIRHTLRFAALASLLISPVLARDIAGTFADKGVKIGDGDSVSLHALFNLQFDAELGRANYGGTAQVRIRPGKSYLNLNFVGSTRLTVDERSWRTVSYEADEGEGTMVRIQSPLVPDDSTVLTLETVSAGKLLQVKVIQLEATSFGPRPRVIGTYLFHRA
ncbi:hypothetical protein [Synoicihabitans lomoniglobus]|uniref:Uncharacterized protein n=1 Tax=Synoicihabitans lomoniglobus TaxID=2909285 RepID=A0AAF0CMJ3_9BACT|nr:hypothetical protein [Opitutaceae bacterium LMO-M01]WED63351.1 hypothetical protein PXH66_13515 [Opitutaceae bacterium LMO-M01]